MPANMKKIGKIPHKVVNLKPKPLELHDVDYYLDHAREYPYGECWLDTRYREEGSGMTQVMVTRIQPNGRLAFGIFVVDLFCLGIKHCAYNADFSKSSFDRKLELVTDMRELITPDYANGLIYGAVDYAAQLGFSPHSDFERGSHVLDLPGTYPLPEGVEFGSGGKPLYIAGPYDDTAKIFAQLSKSVGERNFDYLLPVDPPKPEE